jgi:prevent-host-death family protein
MTIWKVLMSWPVYSAKARFSELLDAAVKDGPQIVTRRGVETAVLVPIDEWQRLTEESRPSIKDVLLDPNGPRDLFVPPRRRLRLRAWKPEG